MHKCSLGQRGWLSAEASLVTGAATTADRWEGVTAGSWSNGMGRAHSYLFNEWGAEENVAIGVRSPLIESSPDSQYRALRLDAADLCRLQVGDDDDSLADELLWAE